MDFSLPTHQSGNVAKKLDDNFLFLFFMLLYELLYFALLSVEYTK